MPEFTDHETVDRWISALPPTGIRPAADRARKLELLQRFCAAAEVDPDTMIAKSRADKDAKNGYLRTLVRWAKELPGSDRARHDAEMVVRSFFMKNGFRVVTKPYQDVYRRTS